MNTAEPTPKCPQCGSNKLYKDGLRYLADGTTVQRWLCRECGYRFTNPNHKSQSCWKNPPFNLNLQNCINNNCQGNNDPEWRDPTSLGRLVQTLATVEKEDEEKSGQAGATERTTQQKDVKSAIISFIWKLKRDGYSEATIKDYAYIIEVLVKRGANIFDPEHVKEVIANQNAWSTARKWQVVKAYSAFAKMFDLCWTPPKYKPTQKLPFIPTEEEINQLIAGCSRQMATFLQLLKETGVRCGEAFNLKWTDIDTLNNTVRITPEKSSNPRIFKISNKLASMLANLPKKSHKVFSYKDKFYLHKAFVKMRKRIAFKLGNPRILQIRFHTFRHWKATMEYHKTKDILHVMQLLGHKNINNTLIYTQLVNVNENEYVCKVAKTLNEASQLIEAGFEFVCDMEGFKLFRKRK